MKTRSVSILAIFVCIAFLIPGCTARTYMAVDYRLPPAERVLAGQTVRLEIDDARQVPAVLSARAAAELKGFRDRYLLTVSTGAGMSEPAGTSDLTNLFREAFEKRLARMGVTVAAGNRQDVPLFAVTLKEMTVDLADRRWTARVGYTARLSRDSETYAEETVAGSAERLHIMGRKAAETLVSEIFTEVVNRVDVPKLFRQAGLQ